MLSATQHHQTNTKARWHSFTTKTPAQYILTIPSARVTSLNKLLCVPRQYQKGKQQWKKKIYALTRASKFTNCSPPCQKWPEQGINSPVSTTRLNFQGYPQKRNLSRVATDKASGVSHPCSIRSVAHSMKGLVHVSRNNCSHQRSSSAEPKAPHTSEETRTVGKGQSLNNPTSRAFRKSKSRPSDMWTLRAASTKSSTQLQGAFESARHAVADQTLNFRLKRQMKMSTASKSTNRRRFNYASKCRGAVQIPKSKVFTKLLLRLKCSFPPPCPFTTKVAKCQLQTTRFPQKPHLPTMQALSKRFNLYQTSGRRWQKKISHLALHSLALATLTSTAFFLAPLYRPVANLSGNSH